jgi:ketosteroid isomerase-like protein
MTDRLSELRTPFEISESYWEAECRRDIDGLMAHYHDDGSYEGPDGHRTGYDAIRAGYEEHFRLFPELEVEIVQEFPRGESSAIEFDAVMVDPEGGRYRVRGVNIVEVRDGKFVSVRSYEDTPCGTDQ